METPRREKSRGNGLGNKRWQRYAEAFDRIERCTSQGYHLEAIAILDSLIGDRLASRLSHLQGVATIPVTAIGPLCIKLVGGKETSGVEHDPNFREVTADIRTWAGQRNAAMHGIARVFKHEDTPIGFDAAIESHRQTVTDGIALLQRFDRLDTAVRGSQGRIPGTWPAAFFPAERPTIPRPMEPEVN